MANLLGAQKNLSLLLFFNNTNFHFAMASEEKPDNEVLEEAWNLPSDFDLFTKYQIRKVCLPTKERKIVSSPLPTSATNDNEVYPYLDIECIEPTSPLDILNKASSLEQYDATGHCVWTGAFLLISCMNQITDVIETHCYGRSENQRTINTEKNSAALAKHTNNQQQRQVQQKMQMIELGCGTGIGGLSIIVSSIINSNSTVMNTTTTYHDRHDQNIALQPMKCCFTDEDPAVLKVCKRNCELNGLVEGESYSTQELTWGDKDNKFIHQQKGTFDIILATDVLYDIDLLPPLFETASLLLRQRGGRENGMNNENVHVQDGSDSNKHCHESNDGIFILSHVPRACFNDNNPPEAIENLEQYIIDHARVNYGLELMELIKPTSSPLTAVNEEEVTVKEKCGDSTFDYNADSFVGSAILIFRRSY